MNYEMLKTAAANIRMPEERKYRVIQNCKKEIINNGKNRIHEFYKFPFCDFRCFFIILVNSTS